MSYQKCAICLGKGTIGKGFKTQICPICHGKGSTSTITNIDYRNIPPPHHPYWNNYGGNNAYGGLDGNPNTPF